MFSAATVSSVSTPTSSAWSASGVTMGGSASPFGAQGFGQGGFGGTSFDSGFGSVDRILQQNSLSLTMLCACGPSGCNCKQDNGIQELTATTQLLQQMQQNTQNQQLNTMVNLLLGLLDNGGGGKKKKKKKKDGGAKAVAGPNGASAVTNG